ncbi:hypothetical protein BO85DRAFT_503992 [Aspergillus piperis CBS 112811]|uniref:Nudix hydrolase domain-containing protein n=1 Tax=Aspergillus piperis CBS 112811 TaxID=1448313 RepID=A0A8G1VHY4_9EURO|nr:hypothetical protein BO85DRAFT_503992 [Aspergillus piperis CBS 112811]RAH53811.1 hypothetical protein BO85DRAFT_503992 [Aspergillus piperis CBS 112811]
MESLELVDRPGNDISISSIELWYFSRKEAIAIIIFLAIYKCPGLRNLISHVWISVQERDCRLKHLEYFYRSLSEAQYGLKVGVLIFSSLKDCVLFIKRSGRFNNENSWECPGGTVEQSNESIIYITVYKCHEKTQLYISIERNRKVHMFIFIVNVYDNKQPEQQLRMVILNPAEHQQFQWAMLMEIERMGEALFLPKKLKGIILDAFEFLGTPGC